MIAVPPKVSRAWSGRERLAVIAWISRLTLERIERDDPTTPVLAKQQVRELFRAIEFLSVQPRGVLEQHRAILLKPYDDAKDHYGVEVPQHVLNALRAGE